VVKRDCKSPRRSTEGHEDNWNDERGIETVLCGSGATDVLNLELKKSRKICRDIKFQYSPRWSGDLALESETMKDGSCVVATVDRV